MNAPLIDDNTGFDEPAEVVQTAATTKASLAITDDMTRIKSAISEFDRVSAGLAELEARYPKDVIYEVGTTKGMKAALEHRAAYRDPRITVEKTRKSAKAPVIALGKNIDARAAWLTDRLREGEDPVDQQIKAEEARKEAEREAKAAAEFGRVLAIQEALAGIAIEAAAACGKTSADIGELLERLQTTQPDPAVFQEMMEQAKAAWAAAITKLETAHKAKLWEEAEQRRVAAEQEAQRLAAQQAAEEMARQRAENERIAAEQRAERERMAAERAEFERERAAMQAERDRFAAEAQARADEAARVEREAQERAAAEARQREEADALAAREREAAEALAGQQAATPNTPEQGSQQVLKAEAPATDATDRDVPASTSPSVGSMGAGQAADAAPQAEVVEVPMLKLGELWDWLGFTDREPFLASLGFPAIPAAKGTGKLYRETDKAAICEAISAHVLLLGSEAKKAA